MRSKFCLGAFALLGAILGAQEPVTYLEETLYTPLDHPAIQYKTKQSEDPVAKLNRKLASGKAKLDFDPAGGGYLRSVLKQLNVPIDSQTLVFSDTSIQAEKINPRAPRALYFSDDVTVGYVQGGEALEFAALDPIRGVYLYTLDSKRAVKPEFTRREDCLRCHQGPVTLAVPGLLVASVHPASVGRDSHGSATMTDHRIPLAERWGGWYVTGNTGAQTHFGNNPSLAKALRPGNLAKDGTQNLTSLESFFDTSRYLAASSDVVALMTLEHQTRMTNLLIRIGWDTRIAQQEGKTGKALSALIDPEIEQLIPYMLFADEVLLKEPISGNSTFSKTFQERGPKDKEGRSLRDFDLQKRIFKYPVSYMIYSSAFDSLPAYSKDRIYRRLYDVLSGTDTGKKFAQLDEAARKAAIEIVAQTKTGVPAYWK